MASLDQRQHGFDRCIDGFVVSAVQGDPAALVQNGDKGGLMLRDKLVRAGTHRQQVDQVHVAALQCVWIVKAEQHMANRAGADDGAEIIQDRH